MLAVQQEYLALYLALMVGVAVWAMVWALKSEGKVIEVWRRFATERQLRFVLDPSPWYRGKAFHIDGEVRGVAFRIEKFVVRRGKHSQTFTRLTARGRELAQSEVTVLPNHFGTRLAKLFAGKSKPTGDAAFDAKFLVYSKGSEDPSEVLHEAARAELLEFGKLNDLVLLRDTLTLRWMRLERSPEKLQDAIELAVTCFVPSRATVGR